MLRTGSSALPDGEEVVSLQQPCLRMESASAVCGLQEKATHACRPVG